MANQNKWNLMRRVVKIKSSPFSEAKYTYPTNLYQSDNPYLHSSANTFGSAAVRLSTPFRNTSEFLFHWWNPQGSQFGKMIEAQRQRENELYSLFGNKYTFLSILQDSQFQKTNVQVVDKAYKLAFKEIGMHADRIVSYAEQLLNSGQPDGSKNISLSTPMGAADLKKLSLKLSDFAIETIPKSLHEQVKALLKYSPRQGEHTYFVLWALSRLGEDFSAAKMEELFRREPTEAYKEMAKSLAGKLNHLAGQVGEKEALEILKKCLQDSFEVSNIGSKKFRSSITGSEQTSTADLLLEFTIENDLGDLVTKQWSLSVKSSDYRKRKVKDVGDFLALDFKFKDTNANQLLEYYDTPLKEFLRYLFTNISFLKAGKSQTVFGEQPVRTVGKTGLKVVENIVNDIVSVTLPGIMLGDTQVALRTDFFFNVRTKEVIPASELLEKIYNATIEFDGKGYRKARALVTIPAVSGAVNIAAMNKSKTEAGLSKDDEHFVYPQNLLEKGIKYGGDQWSAMHKEPLAIRISETKKIVESTIKNILT